MLRASIDSTMRSRLGIEVATSDQRVSLCRSSNGKSNSVASICVVSSIDTRCTQLKGSSRGSPSSTAAVRRRMVASINARLPGATIGLTALRCSSCLGGSIAMNICKRWSIGASNRPMPPWAQSDENSAWWVSTAMMSW